MNRPTICSTPPSAAGRPATVVPNTTSACPVYRPSSTPHSVCSTVLTVRPAARAHASSPALAAAPSAHATSPFTPPRPTPSPGTVAAVAYPPSYAAQYAPLAARSCPASHSRYRRYDGTAGSPGASPATSAAYTASSSAVRIPPLHPSSSR
jgi:hypothetical protein